MTSITLMESTDVSYAASPEKSIAGAQAAKIADFILMSQSDLLLNICDELGHGKVSYPQFYLLDYLIAVRTASMTEIAAKMGHSAAAATGMVDRVERLGYVCREHADDDRRRIMVKITPKGEAFRARIHHALMCRIREATQEVHPSAAHSDR